MENKIPFHVKMESISGSPTSTVVTLPSSPGALSNNHNNNNNSHYNHNSMSNNNNNNHNHHNSNGSSLSNAQKHHLSNLNLNGIDVMSHKFLLHSSLLHQGAAAAAAAAAAAGNLASLQPPQSHSPSLEPTDLSCKSSPRSNSSHQSSITGVTVDKKRYGNETDNESMCSDNEGESEDGATSMINGSLPSSSSLSSLKRIKKKIPSSRSPSPESNHSITSSPSSSSGTSGTTLLDNQCSPMNLAQSSRNHHNEKNGEIILPKSGRNKQKPPPITGIPTSPTRLNACYASSLQTPIVTFASPFLNKATPAALVPSAAAFNFWNSIASPLLLSPRQAQGSPFAGGANSATHFQFPVGHPNATGLPGTPTGLNFGFSLSPLLSSAPYSPFDPQMLFSSPTNGKSISVLQ